MTDEPDTGNDRPYHPDQVMQAPNPYRLDAGQAFMLGTLVGLLDMALKASGSALSVSPVADAQGNYLRLVRFTLDDGAAGSHSWVLALMIE